MSAAAWGNWPKRLGLTVPFLGGARLGWNQDEHAKPIAPVRFRPALTNFAESDRISGATGLGTVAQTLIGALNPSLAPSLGRPTRGAKSEIGDPFSGGDDIKPKSATNLWNAAKPTDKATRQPSRVGFSGGVKGIGLLLAAFLLSICSLMLNALRQGRKPEPLGPSSGALVVLPDTQEYGTTRASESESTRRELIRPALDPNTAAMGNRPSGRLGPSAVRL